MITDAFKSVYDASTEPTIGSHHDDLVLSERDIRLMIAYDKWVTTARKQYGNEWAPNTIDMRKSRLFWWVRSGHEPLPYPPPTAYSCPWYEVICQGGDHHVLELGVYRPGELGPHEIETIAYVSQARYVVIEEKSTDELTLGFGPYRFRAFRDPVRHGEFIASINGNREGVKERFEQEARDKPTRGWFITRTPDIEDAELKLPALDEIKP